MAGNGKYILALNAGSSSVKFRLTKDEKTVLDGTIDRIGSGSLIVLDGKTHHSPRIRNYREAAEYIQLILPVDPHVILHRVTHGKFHKGPAVITKAVLKDLKSLIPLSPLHLPPSIVLIESFMKKGKNIACFDTMFHRTMPTIASTYAIPTGITRKYDVYRYGFHGLAHQAMMLEAQHLAKRKFRRMITCQLGNGASVCAIRNGQSVDTTMGLTPLEGLMMGTRSGDIDPAALLYLSKKMHVKPAKVLQMLEKESGLLGVGGHSDVRTLLEREASGDEKAALALNMFAYRVRKTIGAYIAALGGVDCIVLSGGISRSPRMREKILAGLDEIGLHIDRQRIKHAMPAHLSTGHVQIWAVEVDEQAHMLELSKRFL